MSRRRTKKRLRQCMRKPLHRQARSLHRALRPSRRRRRAKLRQCTLHRTLRQSRKSAPKPQSTAALPKPAQVSFRVAGVGDGDTLNVRSGPSEFHPSVGRIAPGGRGVQIVGACREEWCPVRHGRLKGLGQPLLSRRGRQPAPLGATGFKQIIAVGPSRADQLLREIVCCERPSVCDRVYAFLSIAATFPAATQAAGVQPQAIALRANP